VARLSEPGVSSAGANHYRHLQPESRHADSGIHERPPIAESDEDKPGVILDYDAQGGLVGVEILDASKHVTDVDQIQFKVAG
jgi:uncharacterized protein YuzE